MRRCRLRLIAWLLCVTLCIASVGLWVRSLWRSDLIEVLIADDNYVLAIWPGGGTITFGMTYEIPGLDFFNWDTDVRPLRANWAFRFSLVNAPTTWMVTVPFWFPTLFFAAAAGWLWPRGRGKPGTCPSCGYDLRATPDRCPECGVAVVYPSTPVPNG